MSRIRRESGKITGFLSLLVFMTPLVLLADRYKITINQPDYWERITYRETNADTVDGYAKNHHIGIPVENAELIWENLDTTLVDTFYTNASGYYSGQPPSGIEEQEQDEKDGINVINKLNGVFLDYNKNFSGGLYDKAGRKIDGFNSRDVFISTKDLGSDVYFIKPNGYESSKITVINGKVIGISDNLLSKISESRGGLFSCSKVTGPQEFSERTYSSKGTEEINFTMITNDTNFFNMEFLEGITYRTSQGGLAKWMTNPMNTIDTTGYSPSTLNSILDTLPDAVYALTNGTNSGNTELRDWHGPGWIEDEVQVYKVIGDPMGGATSVSGNPYILNAGVIKLPNGADAIDIWNESGHASGYHDCNLKPSVMNQPAQYANLTHDDSLVVAFVYGNSTYGFPGRHAGNKYPDEDPLPEGWEIKFY